MYHGLVTQTQGLEGQAGELLRKIRIIGNSFILI